MMNIQIGAKIRLLRKKNEITQDALATHLGITPQAVSRWESGTCYPDIEYLPLIADFFSVNIDELLCYDGSAKEARVRDIIKASEAFSDNDENEKAVAVLREGLAEIPSSYELKLELATLLSGSGDTGRDRPHSKAEREGLAESITLCLNILDGCTDDELRDETKKLLCDIYSHQLRNSNLALEVADKLHGFEYCREIVKATMLTGDLAFRQAQENLILFADNIWWHTYNIACVPDISGNNYSLDEKIEILKKAIAVFDIVFDGDPIFYHDRLANSYRQLAMFFLLKGDKESALDCVEKMTDHAIAYDKRPMRSSYSSVLINSVEHIRGEGEDSSDRSKCERLLAGNFSNRVWSPIRREERFVKAVERMRKSEN